MELDLLLVILPRYTTYSDPPAGISILNAVVKQAGFKSKTFDFNLIFYKELYNEKYDVWQRIDAWMDHNPTLKDSMYDKTLSDDDQKELDNIFSIWLNIIDEHQPKYLGFSIFSTYSIAPALIFIPLVKERFPHIKIIVGGGGTTPHNDLLWNASDYYVQGEGETAILDVLNGIDGPGINGNPAIQIEDMNSIPYPDYSDYPMDDYLCKGKMLRITGSRGCVRRCNFCDVYKIWPIFRCRDGDRIANEIFHQWSTLPSKPDMFLFTDSLINGNMKMLREMCKQIIILKKENPDFKPRWKGQFIAGSPRFTTLDDWDLLEQAGCDTLMVGIESGSEEIRRAMNKKIKDEWLSYCVEQAYKRDINMIWFTIIGFPEELDEDFFQTVKFCEDYKWMNDKIRITLSINEFVLYEADWIIDHREDIHYDKNNNWFYAKNMQSIKEKRLARTVFFQRKILEWGYDYRITNLMNAINDWSDFEKILEDRYGIEVFGDYELYKYYRDELEEQYV